MLLRETMDLSFAHSFKRFAQGAVIGLGLAGLAACGGGGSSTPAKPTQMQEMTITPADPHGNDRASAAPLALGAEGIRADLVDADDVDWFVIEVEVDDDDNLGVIEFTLDAGDVSGVEIAIFDSNGVSLASDVTDSPALIPIAIRLLPVVVRGGKQLWRLYVQIRAKSASARMLKGVKYTLKALAAQQAVSNVIRLIQGIPEFTLKIGGAGFTFSIDDHFRVAEGRMVRWSITASGIPGVEAAISGDLVRIEATGQATAGNVRLTLKACELVLDQCVPVVEVPFDRKVVAADPADEEPSPAQPMMPGGGMAPNADGSCPSGYHMCIYYPAQVSSSDPSNCQIVTAGWTPLPLGHPGYTENERRCFAGPLFGGDTCGDNGVLQTTHRQSGYLC